MAGFLFSKASLPCLDDNDICGVVNLEVKSFIETFIGHRGSRDV